MRKLGIVLSCTLGLLFPLKAQAEILIWDGPNGLLNTGSPAIDVSDPGKNSLTPSTTSSNIVRMADGTISGSVYGGRLYSTGSDISNSISANSVSIGGNADIEWNVYGGHIHTNVATGPTAISGSVLHNRIYVGDNANVASTVYGGVVYAHSTENDLGATVDVTGSASYNSISVGDNARVGLIVGGIVAAESDYSTSSLSGNASYNSIRISDNARVSGDVRGGVLRAGGTGASVSGKAVYNTVTLSGSPQFGVNSDLYGGLISGTPVAGADDYSGNTLRVWDYKGGGVRDVINFENYDFILSNTTRHGDTLLRASDTIYLDDSGGIGTGTRSSKVSAVNILGGGTPLKRGDTVTLMSSSHILNPTAGTISNDGELVAGMKGVSLLYNFRAHQNANSVYVTVEGTPKVNPQTKALSEGRLSSLAVLNQGGELISDAAMHNAISAVNDALANHHRGYVAPFAAVHGGKSRYDTGSYADIESVVMVAGISWGKNFVPGRLTLAAFFEAGWADYKTHNSFASRPSVRAKGDNEYYGGGIMGRFDFARLGPGSPYLEFSGRMGRIEQDFVSNDLLDAMGNRAEFDSKADYYGLHAGLGYVWHISEAAALDFYAKYYWTHIDRDAVNVVGDPIRFAASDSHRARVGARFSYIFGKLMPYIGLAYEHEFDGRIHATTYGRAIKAPSLRGGTGMGELGFILSPSQRLSIELAVKGYVGKREGVSGFAQLKFAF